MVSRMESSSRGAQFSPVCSSPEVQQAQRQKLLDTCARHELTNVVLLLEPEPGQETQEVFAHRVVLATASPFFRALFTGGMRESRQSTPRVPLPGVPVAAIRELLRYMYVGELHVEGDTILSVLRAANCLKLQEVVEVCCKQLMLELSVHNWVDIYMFSSAVTTFRYRSSGRNQKCCMTDKHL